MPTFCIGHAPEFETEGPTDDRIFSQLREDDEDASFDLVGKPPRFAEPLDRRFQCSGSVLHTGLLLTLWQIEHLVAPELFSKH